LAWYLDFAFFTEDVADIKFQARLPSAPLDDNSVIATIFDPRDSTVPGPQPRFEFNLSLVDDTASPHDLAATLDRWQSYLTGWVLPRMFAVADGNPPPIAIGL
jgi:hypothetical protein